MPQFTAAISTDCELSRRPDVISSNVAKARLSLSMCMLSLQWHFRSSRSRWCDQGKGQEGLELSLPDDFSFDNTIRIVQYPHNIVPAIDKV